MRLFMELIDPQFAKHEVTIHFETRDDIRFYRRAQRSDRVEDSLEWVSIGNDVHGTEDDEDTEIKEQNNCTFVAKVEKWSSLFRSFFILRNTTTYELAPDAAITTEPSSGVKVGHEVRIAAKVTYRKSDLVFHAPRKAARKHQGKSTGNYILVHVGGEYVMPRQQAEEAIPRIRVAYAEVIKALGCER